MLRRILSNLNYAASKRRYDAAFGHLKASATGAASRVDTQGYGKASQTLRNELHAALERKPQ